MELRVWVILEQSNWNIYYIYDCTITSKQYANLIKDTQTEAQTVPSFRHMLLRPSLAMMIDVMKLSGVLELSERTERTQSWYLLALFAWTSDITYCYWTATMCLNVTYFKKSSREGCLHFETSEGKILNHNILHLNLNPLASVIYAAFHSKSDLGYSYLISPSSKHKGVPLPKVWKVIYMKI